ncbi:hypothetical protein Y032_0077g1146 [Ancylostoma ceylanicum]|uniref:Uncharacterized protein n=1 Tax=Ancylostoma ceylanicum TaxID=53326 RepID=A0A016TU84_9BILA|nr:hypothetical protein Y032_0077g1146 [Ancylostoma ceylanicum]
MLSLLMIYFADVLPSSTPRKRYTEKFKRESSISTTRLTESSWALSTHQVLQIRPEEILQVDWVDPVDAVEAHVNKEIYQDGVFLFFPIEDVCSFRDAFKRHYRGI